MPIAAIPVEWILVKEPNARAQVVARASGKSIAVEDDGGVGEQLPVVKGVDGDVVLRMGG